MLSVVKLSVVMLSVVMLSVMPQFIKTAQFRVGKSAQTTFNLQQCQNVIENDRKV
jgi:hypothetical protein